MAAQHSSIWSRMGDWLKHGGRPTDAIVALADRTAENAERLSADHVPRNGDNGHGNGHGISPNMEESHSEAHHAERNSGLSFFPGRKRQEQAIQRLEQGYHEVVGVIGAIHRHLQTQEEQTREMADSLKSLAATMDRLPAAATSQGETLNAIAYQMQLTSERARRRRNRWLGCRNWRKGRKRP